MRFTKSENQAIKEARTAHPTQSQRGLAASLYERNFFGGGTLSGRSKAAIYGAIRRYDANNRQVVTSSASSRRSRRTALA